MANEGVKTWKRGDINPETNLVYLCRQSSCKDGLRFVTKEEFQKRKEYCAKYSKTSEYKEKQKQSRNTDDKRSKRNEYARTWRKSVDQKEKSASYMRSKRATDSIFAVSGRIRARICESIRLNGYTKKSSIEQILGYSWTEFAVHLEKQFLSGMSWDNRKDWHIDHITPVCIATTEEELIKLNHFTNLRPIWAVDNRKKNGKQTLLI